MPFLRFTRDRRGYENTILLHASQPGERPRVLYWYRSAPGVRVGRPALDEDAIRTIEEQHPDVEFDWPHILEVGAASPPEIERRPERPRRKPKPRPEPSVTSPIEPPALVESAVLDDTIPAPDEEDELEEEPAHVETIRAHDLLEELVGREIATRLRARYAEISARIHQLPAEQATRDAWHARAEALDPDSWITPKEILDGVSRADELFDKLRRELLGHG